MPMLLKLMRAAADEGDLQCAMFYNSAYILMARVQSELLPITFGGSTIDDGKRCSAAVVAQCNTTEFRVHLRRRKNARLGATIRRLCTCCTHPTTCPTHTLAPWYKTFDVDERPFGNLTAGIAVRKLRRHLAAIGVSDAERYTLHAFRRGAAQDLAAGGCTIVQLLRAGGWRSKACFQYLDQADLNMIAAAAYMANESDSD
jgi:hypothetical protein